MSILLKLASSLNKRDEEPNIKLAQQIVDTKDTKSVDLLIENLSNKDKNIQSDCIKVLYEIGERKAEIISGYGKNFMLLLENKNNRLVWGAMTALDCITEINPKEIYKNLTKILDASNKGSVIIKDHAISILIKLAKHTNYSDEELALLLDQLKDCPTNQLPIYAENSLAIINDKYKKDY